MRTSPEVVLVSAVVLAVAACATDPPPAAPDASSDAGVGGADAPDGEPASVTSAWDGEVPPRLGFCDAPDVTGIDTLPATITVDTATSARDHARPSIECTAGSASAAADVVLEVTAPIDGVLTVRTDLPGTDPWLDTVVYARTGCAADGEELGCDDDGVARGGASRLAIEVTAGAVVYVVIDGASSADAGMVEARIELVPTPPPSDPGGEMCSSATDLAFSGEGDTRLAIALGDTSMSTNDGGCAGVPSTRNLPDLFHAFTLDDVRDVTIEVIPDAAYDAAFYVVSDCADLTGLACVDYGPPGFRESTTLLGLAPGRYVIGIDAFEHREMPDWQHGTYELRVTARRP